MKDARNIIFALGIAVCASVTALPPVATATTIRATDSAPDAEDEEELAALLALLEEETEIATHSRMNADFVPGIVTVLHGEELEALGFETVWDALSMVPGMQPVRGTGASPSVIVRGIHFPFNSGNIKILLDSVPLSRESAGVNSSLLYIPIEQVDRIEVIRGPGSVIYGDFAFMGLVNIIPRKSSTSAFLRGNSDEATSGGFQAGHGTTGDPWQFFANVAGWTSDEAPAAGNQIVEEDRVAGVVSLRRGGFSISGQLVDRDANDLTPRDPGPPGPPGPPPAPPADFDESSWALQADYSHELSGDLQSLTWISLLGTELTAGPTSFEDEVLRGGLEVVWDGMENHSWLGAIEFSALEITSASHRLPNRVTVLDGVRRDVFGVTLQDTLDLSERLSVTLGARFDDYSDIGSKLTPRLSLVWRATDNHIFKTQYAEGFRAPTFFELFGGGERNREIDFELNRTTELNYVYRRPRMVTRVTLFNSELEDMIFTIPQSPLFGNTREASSQGVEVEWTAQLGTSWKVIANGSWFETDDNRGPTLQVRESEAAADWLADLSVLYNPIASTTIGAHWYHVGERQTPRGDRYDLVDLTVSRKELFHPDLGIRAGLRNALGDDQIYVSPQANGNVAVSRFDDRTWWLQLTWTWAD